MNLKFCGLRRPEDIAFVNAYPPDYAGFVFAESRRQVTPETARLLTASLSASVRSVGVFVNEPIPSLLATIQTANLSIIQLHGDEDASYIHNIRSLWAGPIWKAVRVHTAEDIWRADALDVDLLLLDAFSSMAYGGTGQLADLSLISRNRPHKPFFLAGGLNADNIMDAISLVKPIGVDISGGIETKEVKDANKMETIHSIVRGVKEYDN